ncbi:surfeit locus protein 6-domain-containing protein [Lipomyces arxii]|uniref:surfeit locus protein 6-domain-containing protein n=1 Tax=Lipomyces arxii TaxID=56418 RepID=UPI0034CFFB60
MTRKPAALQNDEDLEEEKFELKMKGLAEEEESSVSSSAGLHSSQSSEAGSETERSSTNTNDGKDDTVTKTGPPIDELRRRLQEKIQTLRAQRKAPGSGIPGAPINRDAILQARKMKDQARKESLKRKREAAEAEVKKEQESNNSLSVKTESKVKEPEIDTSSTIFTKFALKSGEEVTANGEIQAKKRRKGPVDLLGQLKHVEAKRARIASMDKDKRASIEEKEKWKRAIKQAEGEKVKDDDNLLRKSLKKLQKQKKKSAREWKEREENVAKGIKARQKKREENIAARKEQKKGKSSKKSKGKSPSKKRKRPGFEGGVKSKK